jgi:hypothetical protein
MRTAMRSAADSDDVGWPDPAAVLQRMASTRNCRASRRMSSSVRVITTPFSSPPVREELDGFRGVILTEELRPCQATIGPSFHGTGG